MSETKIRSNSQHTKISKTPSNTLMLMSNPTHNLISNKKNYQPIKLPLLKLTKVLHKIGTIDKPLNSFTPTFQQRQAFLVQRQKQLRQQFTKRTNKLPFQYQLDQIVLDCWSYGSNYGRKTIWKKYKEHFDQLTFHTLKVVHKKKI